MGVKAGLNPQVMCDIINAGERAATAPRRTGSHAPSSPARSTSASPPGSSYKDVRMCVDEAENLGVPMVAGSLVRQMLAATKAR